MIRMLPVILIATLVNSALLAQVGNEWIEYGQTYYKFRIAEDGVFRISQETLTGAGLANVDADAIRLYHMGEEVPVFVSTDGILAPGDFIEFVGYQNRGELDRRLYENPDAEHLNPYYSMFTDSSAYFLTVSGSGAGKRVETIDNDLTNLPDPEGSYMHEELVMFTDDHFGPRLQPSTGVAYSHFVAGEGFAGGAKSNHAIDFSSSAVDMSGDSADLTVRLVASNLTAHEMSVSFLGDTIFREVLTGTAMRTAYTVVSPSDIEPSMTVYADDLIAGGRVRVAFIKWEYPRLFQFDNASFVHLRHQADNTRQYFEINDFDHSGQPPVVYDLAGAKRTLAQVDGAMIKFALPPDGQNRDLYIASQAGGIQPVNDLSPVTFTDWSGDNPSFIILS
ncbi:MAG: hypothetical protein R3330_15110, partial [Saprospiraceae bacterium]|nr:hypothetical protein [Saprospiraceae bacterium]